jgi:hypothetical protein
MSAFRLIPLSCDDHIAEVILSLNNGELQAMLCWDSSVSIVTYVVGVPFSAEAGIFLSRI